MYGQVCMQDTIEQEQKASCGKCEQCSCDKKDQQNPPSVQYKDVQEQH